MMMTTLSREHISAIRFASYNVTVARVPSQMSQARQTCTGFAISLVGIISQTHLILQIAF